MAGNRVKKTTCWWDEKKNILRIVFYGTLTPETTSNLIKETREQLLELKRKGIKGLNALVDIREAGVTSDPEVRKLCIDCFTTMVYSLNISHVTIGVNQLFK